MSSRPAVLVIAGSDSGGGAGIQADLRAISSFAVHAATAITAVTAQNSREVSDVMVLPSSIIERQIDAVMSDLQPAVVKIGMLGNVQTVRLVARKIEQWQPAFVVLDPVMIASSGAMLLEEEAIDALRDLLVPLSDLVTPNWPEAGELIRAYPRGLIDVERIAIAFQRLGARNLLLKGGHLEGDEIVDTFFDGARFDTFTHPRIKEAEGHGTGCALASAVAAGVALDRPLDQACRTAVDYVWNSLSRRYAAGSSVPLYLDLESETSTVLDRP